MTVDRAAGWTCSQVERKVAAAPAPFREEGGDGE